jgi:serine/threonine-protein kinase
MIELRTLGVLDLRHADGTPMQAVLAQPRRLALLVYLATAGRGPAPTFHRRDALLAMFWPDAADGRARDALKVAVHFLRRALGEGVLISRGAGELGIAADAITCDATVFEHAAEEGALDDAAAVYRGEFLPAFHISDAPGFEEWMERERARLSGRYRRVLHEMARASGEVGDVAATAALWRRVVDAGPLDTAAVIALMRALERAGDRAGALLVAREHEQRVRDELDADVDPSVRALEGELRRSRQQPPETPRAPSVATRPVGATGHLPVAEVPNVSRGSEAVRAELSTNPGVVSTGSDPAPRRRTKAIGRRAGFAAGVIAATATLVTAALVISRERSAAPPPRRERVLVAPLENRTGDSSLYSLGEMAADWIAQGLQETGLAEVVDPLSALVSRHRAQDDVLRLRGLARAGALARVAGAGSVVWGAVYRSGDSLVFRAQVSDVAAGQVRIALEPVSTSAADPRKGVEQLRAQVAGALAALLDRRVASVTDPMSRPPTLEAYREYALGLETFQRDGSGDIESIPHFVAASRLDTTFMTPRVWLVFAYSNSDQKRQSDSMVAVLAARRRGLARVDRYALDYFEAMQHDDRDAMLTAAREAARLSPGSEWSFNAGNLLLDKGKPHEALLYLQQIDPEHGWARQWNAQWAALARAHHWPGEYRKELAAAERLAALSPESRPGRYLLARALMSVGRVDAAEQQANVLLQTSAPDEKPLTVPVLLAAEFAGLGYAAAARRLYESAVDWPRTPAGTAWVESHSRNDPIRRALEGDIAIALYELGRWGEVPNHLLATDTSEIDARLLGTLAAVRQGDRTAAEKLARFLDAAKVSGGLPDADYYRARLAAVLGDKEAAVKYLRALWAAGYRRYGFEIHRESDFQSLRDDPRLKLLMRPSE